MKNRYKSMSTKILKYFLILTLIIVVLMWIYMEILLSAIYRSNRSRELRSNMTNVVATYNTDGYQEKLQKISAENDLTITVFKLTSSTDFDVLFSSARSAEREEKAIVYFLNKMQDNQELLTTYRADNSINLLYGKIELFEEGNVFFLMSTSVDMIDGVRHSVINLVLAVSVSAIVIAMLLSVWLSRKISSPLQTIAGQAQKISEGKKDVEFDSREYLEAKQLSDTLNYAMSEIQKSDKIQQEVISNVSHELRTPLTMIKSYAELIKDIHGDNAQKREEDLNVIIDEVEKLNTLVNDMIDLSKMKSNTMSYNMEKFDLCEVIKKLFDYYQAKYQDFEFELDIVDKCVISADKTRIEQVIVNLLNNAINYSMEQKHIQIRLKRQDDEEYRFSVVDHGIGIDEKDLENIFVKHFRSVQAQKIVSGSGIGLSIVKEILDYHNMPFGVESKKNQGSDFYFIVSSIE